MIRASISSCRLFCGLSDPHIEHLENCARFQSYGDGVGICREGEVGASISLLVKGRVSVASGSGGSEVVLAELAPGELWGEMTYVLDGPRTATIRAVGQVDVLEWSFDEIQNLCDSDARVGMMIWRNLAGILAERLGKANNVMSR